MYVCERERERERGRARLYLIEGVVDRHGDGVGVQHEPLPKQCEETVCVHDLHLSPVEHAHTQTHTHARTHKHTHI